MGEDDDDAFLMSWFSRENSRGRDFDAGSLWVFRSEGKRRRRSMINLGENSSDTVFVLVLLMSLLKKILIRYTRKRKNWLIRFNNIFKFEVE